MSGVDVTGAEVNIYNALGVLVKTAVLVNNSMDVSNLAKGVYFIKLTIEGAEVTKKLIMN